MKGTNKPKWKREFANERGRLFQGIRDIKGTNTCFFIQSNKVPQESKVTYSHIICDIRPQKTETHRVRLTVGGDKISYKVPVSTPTADLRTSKLHWRIIVSTPDGKYLIFNVKNFYLRVIPAPDGIFISILTC